jgi:release factor glutamine methyltransferase
VTIVQRVGAATSRLVAAGLPPDAAALDAEVLARHVLGWNRAAYLCNRRDVAPHGFGGAYDAALDRRAGREPVSSIVGRREFWGLEFEVAPCVLTPRPETELLVEETLRLAGGDARAAPLLADVGTGSGCVAIALATELPAARIIATDISAAALAVARRNAAGHGVDRRIAWVRTSCLDGVRAALDVIVANPPYVPDGDLAGLPPEVRDFEPRLALAGGRDGLDVVRRLLDAAARQLAPGGHLVLELGRGQAPAARDAVAARPQLALVTIRRDLQGIARALVVRRRAART